MTHVAVISQTERLVVLPRWVKRRRALTPGIQNERIDVFDADEHPVAGGVVGESGAVEARKG